MGIPRRCCWGMKSVSLNEWILIGFRFLGLAVMLGLRSLVIFGWRVSCHGIWIVNYGAGSMFGLWGRYLVIYFAVYGHGVFIC